MSTYAAHLINIFFNKEIDFKIKKKHYKKEIPYSVEVVGQDLMFLQDLHLSLSILQLIWLFEQLQLNE